MNEATKAVADMKDAFTKHVVRKITNSQWLFEEPGTLHYHCYISVTASGTVIVTGDLGDLILHTGGDGLAWLRGVVKAARAGSHSYHYIAEKMSREMRDDYYKPSKQALEDWCNEFLAEAGLPPYSEILKQRKSDGGKDVEVSPFFPRPRVLQIVDVVHEQVNFDEFTPWEVYALLSHEGVDHDYPCLTEMAPRFYWLVEALRCFMNTLDSAPEFDSAA